MDLKDLTDETIKLFGVNDPSELGSSLTKAWGLKEATIEDVLDSVCSTQYTEIEAEPIRHSMRKDENGVTWILGKNGWERKEE